jgi:hypothetical protein
MKDIQATGENFSLKRENPAVQKQEISSLIFLGHFCPHEPVSGSSRPKPMRIHVNPDPQQQVNKYTCWFRAQAVLSVLSLRFGCNPE